MKKTVAHRPSVVRTKKRDDGIPWDPVIPTGETHELFGDEALAQWTAAYAMQYRTSEERAFATTVVAPLL